MSKYPFTPEILDALPFDLALLYANLEDKLLREICGRLRARGELNEVTVEDIRIMRAMGIPLDEIKKAIAQTARISERKVDELLADVVARNQIYYSTVIDAAGLTQPRVLVSDADIEAIRVQTQNTFRNLTASTAFELTVGGHKQLMDIGQAYQWALDKAEAAILTGAESYDVAIRGAVKELADSGIKTAVYDSGHVDQIDVAARRAALTGVSQICAQYTEQAAAYLETPYFEVSAHRGARDIDGPMGWENHKAWQGKVYSVRTGDIYPSIYATCGLGDVTGLEGANCRHRRFPWVEGVSERTYTDKELEDIDPPPFDYEGKTYSMYEATQKQRQIERTIRKVKREAISAEAAGDEQTAITAKARQAVLLNEYHRFSAAAHLPEQRERMTVLYTDD